LAYTCGGADLGHVLSNSGEKFETGNGLVSGDWHFSMVHCRDIFAAIAGQVCDERTRKM
jgi:hypothetical protein